jgi:tetratricopeptide (TPR) repeat protein
MKNAFMRLLEHIGRYNRVIEQYKRATHSAPDSALAYVNWGIELAQNGHFEGAIEKFKTATQMAPNRPEGYTNWGVALAKSNRLPEAIEQFKRATELAPGGIMSYVLWGAALLELGEVDAAKAKYDEAIALGPNNPEPYVNRGIAMARMGMYPEAMQSFKTALALRSYQPQVYFLWGAVLAEIEQHDNAIEKFKLTLRFIPKHADAYHFWSVSLNRLQRYEEAIEKAQLAQQLNPDKPEVYLNWGDALANLGQHQAAIANYQQALGLDPSLADAHLSWGMALLKLTAYPSSTSTPEASPQPDERLINACEQFAMAQALNPELPQLHACWGNALVACGQYDDALSHLEQAFQQDCKSIPVLLDWAKALMQLGQPDVALSKLRMAELLDQWHPQVNLALGKALLNTNQFAQAIEHCQRALDGADATTDQGHVQASTMALSMALCQSDRAPDAVRAMRALWRKHPESAVINAMYAKVLVADHSLHEAEVKYRKALDLDPTQPDAVVGLATLFCRQKQFCEAHSLLQPLVTQPQPLLVALVLQADITMAEAEAGSLGPAPACWQSVLSAYSKALTVAPSHLPVMAAMAYCHDQLHPEATPSALTALRQSHQDDPEAVRYLQAYQQSLGQKQSHGTTLGYTHYS